MLETIASTTIYSAIRENLIAHMYKSAEMLGICLNRQDDELMAHGFNDAPTHYLFIKQPVTDEDTMVKKILEYIHINDIRHAAIYIFETVALQVPWEHFIVPLVEQERFVVIPMDSIDKCVNPVSDVVTYRNSDGVSVCAQLIACIKDGKGKDLMKLSAALLSAGHSLEFYVASYEGKPAAILTQSFLYGIGSLWDPIVLPGFENRGMEATIMTVALQNALLAGCIAVVAPLAVGLQSRLKQTELQGVLSTYEWSLVNQVLVGREHPSVRPANAVLLHKKEFEEAIDQLNVLQLPLHTDPPKNWDSLAALSIVLANTLPESNILDAGGEYYSSILPQLAAYGYENLNCINLQFRNSQRKGKIIYEYGNIIRTRFDNNYFDAITCLSVVEHGIGWEEYFREMARILKSKGILITSTDFWSDPIDTGNKTAYGVPVKIFTEQDIRDAVDIANQFGFKTLTPVKFECEDQVVACDGVELKYTFMYFTLMKS